MTTILVGVSTVAFVLLGGAVGVRLLLLAGRTGGLPERALGVGFTLVAGIGYPLNLISLAPATPEGLARVAFAAATAAAAVGSSAIFVFTRAAFRPRAGWAKAVVTVACSALLVEGALASAAAFTTPRAQWYAPGLRLELRQLVTAISYAWTAIEGLVQWRMARRRVGLGLCEPVVANRFALWAISGSGAFAGSMTISAAMALGINPMHADWTRLGIGLGGLTASVCVALAFLPPASYLAWVRRRAASGAA